MTLTELFFYGGIALMVVAAVLSILTAGVLWLTGHRLRSKLEKEYGKKQR